MQWRWNESEKTWLCGEPNLGCGVFETDDGWEASVVIFNETYSLTRDTKEEAMAAATACFNRLYDSYHELVN